MSAPEIKEIDFRQHVAQTGQQLMWFLGAGASRSSGLPTATDLTWDLKLRYYCAKENQDVVAHDVSNRSIQARIQAYMDSKGFPPFGIRPNIPSISNCCSTKTMQRNRSISIKRLRLRKFPRPLVTAHLLHSSTSVLPGSSSQRISTRLSNLLMPLLQARI